MDGEAFRAARLRDRPLAWIPVVLLSGAVGGDQKARELLAAAFLPKPIDIDVLREMIEGISAALKRTAELAAGERRTLTCQRHKRAAARSAVRHRKLPAGAGRRRRP
jgi:CheY-like chemotaxis protein